MSLQMRKLHRNSRPYCCFRLLSRRYAVGQSPLVGEKSFFHAEQALHRAIMVVVLDINPHQEKVLPVGTRSRRGTIQRLHQAENTFS